MIAFETQLNEESKIIAGAEDVTFLLLEVNGMGRLGEKSNMPLFPDRPEYEVLFSITGFTDKNETKRWESFRNLKIGDKVKIKLTEVTSADEPESREVIAE